MIFGPHSVPQGTPISQLRGNFSKIASMAPNLVTRGSLVPNMKFVSKSVWAVGGVGTKNRMRIFYYEEICKQADFLVHEGKAIRQ